VSGLAIFRLPVVTVVASVKSQNSGNATTVELASNVIVPYYINVVLFMLRGLGHLYQGCDNPEVHPKLIPE
jgi:hypothetical protein